MMRRGEREGRNAAEGNYGECELQYYSSKQLLEFGINLLDHCIP